MKTPYLPGIKSIGFCKAENLQPDVYDLVETLNSIKVYGAFSKLPINELGKMAVETKNVKGTTIFETNIKFELCAEEMEAKNIVTELLMNNNVYFCEHVDGRKFLIGLEKKPYPIANISYINDDSESGKKIYTMHISYTNTQSVLLLT